MSKANDELPRIVVPSPRGADLDILLDGCPNMPLSMRVLLLGHA